MRSLSNFQDTAGTASASVRTIWRGQEVPKIYSPPSALLRDYLAKRFLAPGVKKHTHTGPLTVLNFHAPLVGVRAPLWQIDDYLECVSFRTFRDVFFSARPFPTICRFWSQVLRDTVLFQGEPLVCCSGALPLTRRARGTRSSPIVQLPPQKGPDQTFPPLDPAHFFSLKILLA